MRLAATRREKKDRRVQPSATDGELDLRQLGSALWRKKWRILIPTILTAVAAAVAVNMIAPRYKSEARVLIENRENAFLRPEAEKTQQDRTVVDPEAVTSQVQLVLSRDLALEVIKKLKLNERPEFDPVLAGISPLRVFLSMIGVMKDPLRMTPEERVLDAYYARLNAFSVDKSRVIAIEFWSTDPELAARVANAIAEGYLVLQQQAKQDQTRAAGQWLSAEIEKLRVKVSEAEKRVEDFRSKANLFVGTNNTTLVAQQLAEFNSQVAAARAQKADAEARTRLIREILKARQSIEFSDILNSELIRRLSEQRVTLRAQLAEQSSTLLGNHPRIRELRAQIADLDVQLRGEAEKLARSLENEAKLASARVEALTANFDQLKRQAALTGDQEVQLRVLEREAKAQRDLFESYLAKLRETTARDSIAAAPADARIISHAVVSTIPYFPKKLPTIIIAAFAMFVLSSGLVATGALLSAGAPSAPSRRMEPARTELARTEPARMEPARTEAAYTESPALAPEVPPPTVRVSEPSPAPAPAAAPATVRAAVPVSATVDDVARALRAAGEDGRRVTVLGAVRNVGTTLTAIALARALARDGRVVLIDLALGAPNLDVISLDRNAPGIADLVRGTASFGQIITRDRFSRVHLVALGRLDGETRAMLSSERLIGAVDALARTYDHVVIDGGAVPELAAEAVAQLAPRAVLVAAEPANRVTAAIRTQLLAAGFSDVTVLSGPPQRPDADDSVHFAAA
jgi:succinoglycan biosynthesis transport protein ExoP